MTVIPRSNEIPSLSAFLVSDGPAGFLLSWVAGFVDTSAFIILFGIFTAHVTGNIALAGSSFVSEDAETTLTRLLMLPAFVITVALASLLAKYARHRKWSVFAVLLTAEAIALSIFLVVGTQLSPALLLDVQEEYILPIGMSGVMSMAIQNALMKESKGVFKSYIPTTVMTGNTTQLTIDVVQYLSAKFATASEATKLEAAEAMERMSRFIPVIVGFALGGLAAAFFVLVSESWWSLVFPLAIVSLLATAAYTEHSRKSTIT
ncbi:YoaK family protein [Chamaesiphon minutus]|uniref:Putative membrane protein n=1 Tax=Chamaesiphon minutus (strain ATCC 27169 / PCC 6605) TaxID=1173020 RepID=K9UCG6_CHAP6|nr:YoaK family protein [Chamaesiphon minutus]AFY92141.1 putative membrane protein [Chamaesiphon minutus PCC 6605]